MGRLSIIDLISLLSRLFRFYISVSLGNLCLSNSASILPELSDLKHKVVRHVIMINSYRKGRDEILFSDAFCGSGH